MESEVRNSYIINHSLRAYLAASILSCIANQLNATINGIIVSNAVGADAISAITLVSPISFIVMIVGAFITSGAVLLMGPAFGNQRYIQVNNIYSVSIASIFILNGLLALLAGSLASPIAHMLTDEERLLPLMIDYMPCAFVSDALMVLSGCLTQFVGISGKPRIVTRCILTVSVTNILFALLFVFVFDSGMKGVATASALSAVAGIVSIIPYLLKSPRPFMFHIPKPGESLTLLEKCFFRGLPEFVATVAVIILFYGLNTITLQTQGADDMFITSVFIQTISLGFLVTYGVGDAVTGIGGVLRGEQDWAGLNHLLNTISKYLAVVAVISTLVLFLFPSLMAQAFGADEALLAVSEQPLRMLSLVLIPIFVLTIQSQIFLVIDKGFFSSAIQIGFVVFILLPFWAAAYWAPSYLWVSPSIGMWVFMLCCIGISSYLGRKELAHWFYLTPLTGSVDAHSVSVRYDFNDVQQKLKDLLFYISIFDIDEERMKAIEHSLEEVMINQYEMGVKEQKTGTFDVNVVDAPERFTIIVKDVGKAYNPLVSFKPDNLEDIDEDRLSIMMIQGICDEVNYKYLNGINCLYLNIKKNTS